jgi:hypothetical protein
VGPDGYGNNFNEGPLWIRPEALKKTALDNWNFVCGHTEINNNESKAPVAINHNNNGKIILADTSGHNNIFEIDTITGEYRMI